jgi:hypothetical protein
MIRFAHYEPTTQASEAVADSPDSELGVGGAAGLHRKNPKKG